MTKQRKSLLSVLVLAAICLFALSFSFGAGQIIDKEPVTAVADTTYCVHVYGNGKCTKCGACQHIVYDLTTRECINCHNKMSYRLIVNSTVSFYNDSLDAGAQIPENATVETATFSPIYVGSSIRFYFTSDRNYTLDLIGNSIYSQNSVSNSTIVIKDSVGGGYIDLSSSLGFSNCNVTINNVKIVSDSTTRAVSFKQGTTAIINGGTFDSIVYLSNVGQFTFNSGTIKTLYFQDTPSKTKTKLCGGTIGSFSGLVNNTYGNQYATILAKGKAYALTSDGSFVKLADMKPSKEVKIVDCKNHSWTKGVCDYCGEVCAHGSYANGKCTVCGMECTHGSYTDGKCDTCGIQCTHNYQNGVCTICGIQCPHKRYTNGVCTVCGIKCTHGTYTDGKCDTCGIQCTHNYNKNGVCTICGMQCPHDHYTNGKCDVCGMECTHEDVDQTDYTCNDCGKQMVAAVISSSATVYYSEINTAIKNLGSNTTLKILSDLNNVALDVTYGDVTIDLNGKSVGGGTGTSIKDLTVRTSAVIKDSSSSKTERTLYLNIPVSSARVMLSLNEYVNCVILHEAGTIGFYGGKIVGYTSGGSYSLVSLLPANYALRKTDENGSELVAYKDGAVTEFNGVVGGTVKSYYTVEECLHTDFDDDFKCVYCKADVDLKQAVKALRDKLNSAVEELNNALADKVDSATLTKKISDLTLAYKEADALLKKELQGVDEGLAKDITDLKTAYAKADTELQAGIDRVQTNLEAAEERLKNLISAKASSTDLTAAIEKLDSEYKAADELIKTNIGKDISALDKAYKEADTELQAGIDRVQTNLEDAETRLKNLISEKASSTDLTAAIKQLQDEYKAADELLKTNIGKDITALDKAYKEADESLQAGIDRVQSNLEDAETRLKNLISEKASSTDLTTAIEKLQGEYKAADELLKTNIGKDITALDKAYKEADESLQAGIDRVQANLEEAETRLKGLIDAKASSTDLTAAIAKLDSEYKAADELLKTNIGKDITALDKAYKEADESLQAGIDQVQANLEAAEERLKNLISAKASSIDLTAAIEKLDSEYKAADELLKTNIGKDISALDKAYKKADTELQAGIDQVQANLEAAEERLKNLISAKASSEDLTAAIEKLDSEYKAADELLKTNIGKDITALDEAYKEADESLQAGIDRVQTNLEDAETRLKNLISAKASSTDLTTAIEKLQGEYKAADELLKTNIGKDITALDKAYKEADESLQAGIDQVQSNLEDAETRLKTLISEKASSAELTAAIAKLDSEYKAADELLKSELQTEDGKLEQMIKDLTKTCGDAHEALWAGIQLVQDNLDEAKRQLEEKDKDLESRLNSVKENGEKNDTIFMVINIVLGVAVVALAAVLVIGKVTDKRKNIK